MTRMQLPRACSRHSCCSMHLVAAREAANTLDQLLDETKNLRASEARGKRSARGGVPRQPRPAGDAAGAGRSEAGAGRSAQPEALGAVSTPTRRKSPSSRRLLRERSGNLGELFGVTRQVAADTAVALGQSMISAQFPERDDFLRKLADAKALPSITELERLWFEMQREMTESGRVARLPARSSQRRRRNPGRRGRPHRFVHRDVGWRLPDLSARRRSGWRFCRAQPSGELGRGGREPAGGEKRLRRAPPSIRRAACCWPATLSARP